MSVANYAAPGTIRVWIFGTYIYNIKSVEEVNLFKYVKLAIWVHIAKG